MPGLQTKPRTLLDESEPHQRGFGTASRFQSSESSTTTPGPYTSGAELQLATGFHTLLVKKRTKAQSFDVTCQRFLTNTVSRQNLPDTMNPAPNRRESSRTCPRVGREPEVCRPRLQVHCQVPVRLYGPPGCHPATQRESCGRCRLTLRDPDQKPARLTAQLTLRVRCPPRRLCARSSALFEAPEIFAECATNQARTAVCAQRHTDLSHHP